MQTTGNLGLKKPEGTDIVDIADLNGNMDILDNAVTSKVDKVTGKQLSTNDYTAAEKTKLASIATGATNYTHPATHPPAIIAQDASNRFVTDTEKTAWNAKETPAGAQAKADAAVAAGKADYIRQPGYAATSGTATAYSVVLAPAPTTTPDGFGITIVPHITNGASPTLSVNGLAAAPLKDQKGVAYAAGKLIAGKPYMFRRVGTDFLADSAGGSGNAVAGDIRAGKTAATDEGDITGTLPVQTGGTVTPGATAVVKAAGIYDAAITVAAVTVPADKVLAGTTIAGTAGTMVNRANDQVAPRTNFERVGRVGIGFPTGAYVTSSGFGAGIASVAVESAGLNPAYVRSDVNILGMQGSMPVINDAADPATGIGIWPDGGLAVYPREGYRKGGAGAGEIKVPLSMLRTAVPLYPEFIKAGVDMFNVVGTLEPKQYATGTGNVSVGGRYSVIAISNSSSTVSVINITGLPFKPTFLRVTTVSDSSGSIYCTVYTSVSGVGDMYLASRVGGLFGDHAFNRRPTEFLNNGTSQPETLLITGNSIEMPINISSLNSLPYTWEAWG